jgi:hypothetical protein
MLEFKTLQGAAQESCKTHRRDVEPTGKDPSVKKIGKDSYHTEAEAKADLRRLCEEQKLPPKPPRK